MLWPIVLDIKEMRKDTSCSERRKFREKLTASRWGSSPISSCQTLGWRLPAALCRHALRGQAAMKNAASARQIAVQTALVQLASIHLASYSSG
jgi:hypothetical protein